MTTKEEQKPAEFPPRIAVIIAGLNCHTRALDKPHEPKEAYAGQYISKEEHTALLAKEKAKAEMLLADMEFIAEHADSGQSGLLISKIAKKSIAEYKENK